MKKFVFEYWYHPWSGNFRVTERNPCGCCPDDYIVSDGKGFYQSSCWANLPRRKFLAIMKERGWLNLDKLAKEPANDR